MTGKMCSDISVPLFVAILIIGFSHWTTHIPTPTIAMTVDIRRQLLTAEHDFIGSYEEGTASLETFKHSWCPLVESLASGAVDDDTANLAHDTARRVELLALAFIDFHSEVTSIEHDLLADLDHTFGQLNLGDTTSQQPPPDKKSSCTRQATGPHSLSSYISPACKWLLKNLHNPYPSKETRELISRGTSTSVQSIDTWFLNARRRIGWTGISKRYFHGSKVDTVAAARRALSPRNDEDYKPLPANIQMAFIEMEDAAKELYSEKYMKSELAGTLDRIVKDMTDGDRERRREQRSREKAVEKLKTDREREDMRCRAAQRRWKEAEEGYPSPSPEPESLKRRFGSPSSVDSEDEDLTPPLPIAGRKRTSQESSDEREVVNERPMKRSR